jgi:phosphoribosylaminoimidazolecarboxamide formyltransferase/IMP cyclohydrolase
VSATTRRRLAAKAFARTAAYDGAIADWLLAGSGSPFPESLRLSLAKRLDLVYGENPHQQAAFYADSSTGTSGLPSFRQHQGKPLSFNNILDLDAATALVRDLSRLERGPSCVIVKHGNPSGAACAASLAEAFRHALACDPTSAFGGIIAFDRPFEGAAAEAVSEAFYEAVVAPEISDEALRVLAKKKNLRLLSLEAITEGPRPGWDLRRVHGGLLVQDWDSPGPSVRQGRVSTRRSPTEEEWLGLEFAWTVCRHVKSNAIVYAGTDRTLGVGAGQMSRLDSARIAVQKAQASLRGAVMASDAFFPFRDGLDVGADAGVTAVVQPGGSIRDEEVIRAADERGLAMVLTGRRHFRH